VIAKQRILIFIAVCAVAILAAGGYVWRSRAHHQHAVQGATPVAQASLSEVQSVPHLVFRNTALGSKYGMVAMVPLSDAAGPRAITSTECDRVYTAADKTVCLASKPGVVTTYSAHVLDTAMQPIQTLPLQGIPSRARLSRDARYAATTTFVAGDSYAGTSFSTRTTITEVGKASLGDLEQFTLIHNGKRIAPVNRNYWGVTFASDDDTFYVTVAWSGHTWLARGSMSQRRIVTLHEDAECPSLSPDGTRIVYKQRGSLPPGQWRLVEYTIATGQIVPLAETRSVDDQVEWLDNANVVYGLPRSGSQAAVDDVWEVPANGTGAPKLLIPQAWSPSVVQ
jgi:hypothetical protein